MSNKLPRYLLMKALLSKENFTQEEFNSVLKHHQDFLQAGGGGGRWETLVTVDAADTGIVLGVYLNQSSVPGQAKLDHGNLSSLTDLCNINLSFASLIGVSCEARDLSYSNLQGILATDSFFNRTKFYGANLQGADFSRSDLKNCDFTNANLEDCDFEECDISGSIFTNAITKNMKLLNAEMDNCIDLNWK